MILRITQKLGKKIKTLPSSVVTPGDDPYADWSANLFRAFRTQYIIVSNTTALYSVIFQGKGITTAERLFARFLEKLRDFMVFDGKENLFATRIAPLACDDVVFSKNINRSITGSMNDLIWLATCHLEEDDCSPLETSQRINESPMSRLQAVYPSGRTSNYGSPDRAIAQMELQQPIAPNQSGKSPKKRPRSENGARSDSPSGTKVGGDYWKRIFDDR